MPAIAHHPLTIDQHIAHLAIAAGEQPAIENPVPRSRRQIRIVAIQDNPVRALAHVQRADRLPQCLCTAVQRRVIQGATDHRLLRAIQAIAPLIAQTLTIFQPAQFFHHAQRHMAVGANAHAPALGKKIHRRENSVAQIRFSGQAQPGDRATVGHQRDFFRVGVGGVDQTPALIDFSVLVEPLQRTATAPAQAIVDFFLLLGDVDVHRALFVTGRQHFADLLRRHRTQRVETQAQRLRLLLRQ